MTQKLLDQQKEAQEFMAELEEDSEQHDEFVLPPSVQMGAR